MSMRSSVSANPCLGGRTRQSEAAACDVNLIVAAHRRGGVSSHVMNRVAEYGFAPAADFRECMEQVRQAREVFDLLPARTRAFFGNDPGRFVDYTANPENLSELVKLGLVVPKPKAEPVLGSAELPIVTRSAEPAEPA